MTAPDRRRFLRPAPIGALAAALILVALAAAPASAVDAKYRSQMRTAMRHLMQNNPAEAARLYEEILKQHPRDEPAANGYAQALVEAGRYDEAERFITGALESVEPRVNLFRRREELRRRQNRPEDAFSDALRVMAENDGMGPWVYQETRELIGEGLDPAAAGRVAQAVLAERPDDLNFVVLTAVIVALDQRFPEAIALMVAADDRKKQGGVAVLRYADELATLGYRDQAVEAVLRAADLAGRSPRRSQFQFRAADLYEELGRHQEALGQLALIATERAGTSAAGKALARSAEIYQRHLDDPAGALAVYEKLHDDPGLGHNRPEMLLHMGECYSRLGRFEEAARTYREVLPEALDPEHAEKAAFRLAEVEFHRGRPDSALALYQDMAETYSRSMLTDDAASRYILLNTLSGLGGGEAMALFGRMEWGRSVGDSATVEDTARGIIERWPAAEIAAEAWIALAELAEEAGRFDDALDRLERVVTGFPADRRAAVALKREGDLCLGRLNDPARALAKYEALLAGYPESVLAGEVRNLVQTIRKGIKS